MKNILAASALAATLLTGSAATSFATAATLGTISKSTTKSFSSDAEGTFSDYYSFSLSRLATVTKASITSSYADASQFITDFTISLYKGVIGSGTQIASSSTSNGDDGQETAKLSGYSLGKGDYYLQVSGKTVDSSYAGTLAVTLSPVPLPGTVALFGVALAGLGVAGAIRRKSAVSAA